MSNTLCKIFALFALLLSPFAFQPAFAQPPDTLWTSYIGGEHDEYGDGVIQTNDGGFAISGTTNSFNGVSDFYLAKLSSTGDFLWEYAYGDSALFETCTTIRETADGGLLLAGYVLNFAPFHTDAKLIKTSANGIVIQERTLGFPDSLLSIFAAGEREQGYWIAGKAQIEELNRGFLYFLDNNFEIIEQHYYSRNSLAYFNCGEQLADGGYILAGPTFISDSDPSDVFVVRTTATGDTVWTQTFGGNGDDLISSVAPSIGGFILGGLTTSFEDENGDFYALHLNEGGNLRWSRTFGDPEEEDHGHEIIPTQGGGFLICGHSHDDGGNAEQLSVFKLTQAGDVVWQLLAGSTDNETAESIIETDDHGFAVIATALSEATPARILVSRYAPTNSLFPPIESPRTHSLLENYPNPFNGETTIRFEVIQAGPTQLQLFDLQGRWVSTLTNEFHAAGLHELKFNANNLSSGTYLCRLNSARAQTLPIILLK